MVIYQLSFLLLLPQFTCKQEIEGKWESIADGSTEHTMYCRPEHFCLDDSIRW
jgi:MFS family permease